LLKSVANNKIKNKKEKNKKMALISFSPILSPIGSEIKYDTHYVRSYAHNKQKRKNGPDEI